MICRYLRFAVIAAGCAGVAGCATHTPVVLEPAALASSFQSRSLRDADLQQFIQAAAPHAAHPPGAHWNLTTLTLAALYYQPDLEVSRAKILQAKAAVKTAAQIPNPELNTAATLHSLPALSAWTIGALINFVIETGGRRELRVEQADHLVDAARSELLTASWQVRSKVRSALIALWSAQTKIRLLATRRDLAAELANVLERQLAAGQVTALMVSKERSALNQIRLTLDDANRQAAEARATLAAAIGIPLSALQGVNLSFGPLENPPSPGNIADLASLRRAAVTSRGDLRALLANYEAAVSALKLELAKQYPTIKLGPGYTYDQGDNLYTLSFTADLPVFNRNEGPIVEADTKRYEAGARFNALQAQIVGEVDLATASFRAASKSLSTATALLTTEKQRQRQSARAFAAGESDRPTFLSGELEFAAVETGRLDTLVQYLNSISLLEDALRHPLFDPGALNAAFDRGHQFQSAVMHRRRD